MKNTINPIDRDNLSAQILKIHLPVNSNMSEAALNSLDNIKNSCEAIQQLCVAAEDSAEINLTPTKLHAFLSLIANEARVSSEFVTQLAKMEMFIEGQQNNIKDTQKGG